MWRNMDDRLERRRELLIPEGALGHSRSFQCRSYPLNIHLTSEGALGEENVGEWGEENDFPRLILPKMDNVGKSVYRKVLHLMTDHHHKSQSTANVTGRRELEKEEQEIPTVHTGNFY